MVDSVTLSTPPTDGGVRPGTEAQADPSRPAWLPQNFKSPEDLAKSYTELQAKATKDAQELATLKGVKPTEQAPQLPSDQQQQQTPPPPAEDAAKKAADALQAQQGLDVNAMSERFWKEGKFADGDLDKLVKGFVDSKIMPDANAARQMAEDFAAGQLARREAIHRTVLEAAGGQEGFNAIAAWAPSDTEAAKLALAFNNSYARGDFAGTKAAGDKLVAAYKAANGQAPQVQLQGNTSAKTDGSVYKDASEMVKDMSDPRYKESPAFRAEVQAKVGRSKL
jgi:hypothetical protein